MKKVAKDLETLARQLSTLAKKTKNMAKAFGNTPKTAAPKKQAMRVVKKKGSTKGEKPNPHRSSAHHHETV